MFAKELKVVELLLNYLDSRGNLSSLIEENFDSEEEFLSSKINLFNLISINSILSLNPNFTDKDIDSIVNKIQILSNPKGLDNRMVYDNIIDCLRKGLYLFDKDNNVVLKNDNIKVIANFNWLYYLVSISKKNTFLRVLLFNKNEEMDIHDEKSLLNYLYHTKMFLIGLLGKQNKLNMVYNHAVINTKGMLFGRSKIKTHKIRDILYRNIPRDVKTNISKYDFSNYSMFVEKAKRGSFYDKTLNEQKKMIEAWILEDESVSIEDNINLSKLIVLLDGKKSFEEISELVDVNKCFASLFRICMYILANMDVDYGKLYFSKIRIKNYVDSDMVVNYSDLKGIIREINSKRYNEDEEELRDSIKRNIVSCNEHRTDKDDFEIVKCYKKVRLTIDEFIKREKELLELGRKRNTLQNIIHYKKTNSPVDLAFDNDKILELLEIADSDGRIYVDSKTGDINIDINDKEMGMNVFRAVVSIDDFIYFVESCNEELNSHYSIRNVA